MSRLADYRSTPACGISARNGHRLAGFTDGEGCFVIRTNGRGYACSFDIKLRADDRPVLETVQGIVGHGRIMEVARTSPTRHPQSHYRVATQEGCNRVVDIFDDFPLRSKKARDYAIWREAVIFWSTVGGGRVDWTEMAGYHEALRVGRSFVAERQPGRPGSHSAGSAPGARAPEEQV